MEMDDSSAIQSDRDVQNTHMETTDDLEHLSQNSESSPLRLRSSAITSSSPELSNTNLPSRMISYREFLNLSKEIASASCKHDAEIH